VLDEWRAKKKKKTAARGEEEEERKSAKKYSSDEDVIMSPFALSRHSISLLVSIQVLLLLQITVIALSLISIGLFCRGRREELLLS
jgi:hypothetical protein